MLPAEKITNIEILVPFPKITPSIDIILEKLSNIFESSWCIYKLGYNLSHIYIQEDGFYFSYLTKYVKTQLQFTEMDSINLRQEISETLASKMTNARQRRGVPLVAFDTISAITAGAGVACAVGSLFENLPDNDGVYHWLLLILSQLLLQVRG